jgi:hypothetical protein
VAFPKSPKWQEGLQALQEYKTRLDLHETSLGNKMFRAFYRDDLRSSAKRYLSLSRRRPDGSEAQKFFKALSALLEQQLVSYGEEPAPRRRAPALAKAGTVALRYPDIPDDLPLRVHFLESGSFKRERAAALAEHADHLSRQEAPTGEVLLSAAVSNENVRFFEHLLEATGPDGNGPRWRGGGFAGWRRADGTVSGEPDWQDSASPWRRIRDDNMQARLFHWNPRRAVDPAIVALPDVSWIPQELPWDPDPRFRAVLEATGCNDLERALTLVAEIPGAERETQFDEMIYLRFLTGTSFRAEDLRYVARKYLVRSAIRSTLEEAFESFLVEFDAALSEMGPIGEEFPGLGDMSDIYANDPGEFQRSTPPLSDWPATRDHYRAALDVFRHPIAPRGRIFVWHPGIAMYVLDSIQRNLAPQLVAAENAFRRARGIPEIGLGWASEAALFALVRLRFPDAVHQWRPLFLGQQSIDIYVPSLNLAIEYQGQQHYEAVELFGGKEGLAATQARDARKRALLAQNGVRLLEWRYDMPVTEENATKIFEAY